jgi:hypothetical protein
MIRFSLLGPPLALLIGCGGDSGDDTARIAPMPDSLPGVYAGEFPCSNCAAIEATLWLRPDGRFFLRQSYVGEGGVVDSSYALGKWSWDEHAAEAVLRGVGPERRVAPLDADRLEQRTASPLQHVLTRDHAAPPFTDRLRLDGETVIVDGAAVFAECLTGLRFDVAQESAFNELRRQHRVLSGRGGSALTSVEARIRGVGAGETMREVLVVDRVVGMKPGETC